MLSQLLLVITLWSSLLQSGLAAPLAERAQCATNLNLAATIASRLMNYWYNPSAGDFNSGELWTDANTIEDLHNLMLAAGTDTYASIDTTSTIGKDGAAANSATWSSLINGSNDDSLWIVLAMFKIVDYRNARGLDSTGYMNSAIEIYNQIAAQWDSTVCGGGVWWSTAHTYKNAITNQLFLLTSASGYIRTGQQAFLNNAEMEWNWLNKTGMRNSQGLYNDGLNSNCQNNGQTTWTYNQGVIASGLAALSVATGNKQLLDVAEVTLDAAFSLLTQNGILKESCDDSATGGGQCDHDQQIFKGLLMKHLQYFLDMANDPVRTAKYAPIIGAQASAVLHYGKNSNNDIGSVWYAPSTGGSIFQPEATAGGLAAIVAAAKYGPC